MLNSAYLKYDYITYLIWFVLIFPNDIGLWITANDLTTTEKETFLNVPTQREGL